MATTGRRIMENGRESVATCPVCDSIHTEHVATVKERLLGEGEIFRVVRCQGCGLLRTDPRPTKAEIPHYYPDHYAPYQLAEAGTSPWLWPGLKEMIRRWTLTTHYGYRLAHLEGVRARVIRAVTRPLKGRYVGFPAFHPGGRLLEVGSATGGKLALLRHLGWEVRGVEISEQACHVAKTRYGLDVFCGELAEAGLPDGSMDVVIMSHLIEHVYDPVATLLEVRRILRRGGVVLIETPNVRSLEQHIFGPFWSEWDVPRHLFLFDASTLRLCCGRAGLRIRRVVHSSYPRGWIRSFAYWLWDRTPTAVAARLLPLLRRETVWVRLLKPACIVLT